MQPQRDDVATVLRRYVKLEEAKINAIASELIGDTNIAPPRETAKQKFLKKLELHSQADEFVEDCVERYRADLYVISRRIAEADLESGVITKAHVHQAQRLLGRRFRRYSWGDGLLAVGGLLGGAGVAHLVELFTVSNAVLKPLLLAFGIGGALLLGMGIVDKAKQ